LAKAGNVLTRKFNGARGIWRTLILLVMVMASLILLPCVAKADSLTFQQGDGKGSPSDTDDATLDASNADTNDSSGVNIFVDSSLHYHSVIKFPNIFGNGANQIPLGSTINSATLTVVVSNSGDNVPVYQLIESWVEAQVTWNSRSSGVGWTNAGADGAGSRKTTSDGTISAGSTGAKTVTVTTSVQNWSNGDANEGWVLTDTGSNGVDFNSSENGTAANRPKLTVN
jgi:hypothetical protein